MNETRQSVMICVPSYGLVHIDFAVSLMQLIDYSRQFYGVALAVKQSAVVDVNRNILAKGVISSGADYSFWLDSDIVLPPETIHSLMRHDKEIVGCAYRNRHHEDRIVGETMDRLPIDATGLRKMAFMGFGCMLIKAEVFKKMEWPWFHQAYLQYADGTSAHQTEDVTFCNSALDAGFDIFCDQELSRSLRHIANLQLAL
jgi:hypothetical protein